MARLTATRRPRGVGPVVEVDSVSKRYGTAGPLAIGDLSLTVLEDEILCLLGPSGCGKTTLLRLIAGFERPDAGSITVAGSLVASQRVWVQPERRRIGFVFQDFALFPHLNVLDNVAFGLAARPREFGPGTRSGEFGPGARSSVFGPGTRSRSSRRRTAAEVLDLVGLTVFASRFPHQLSGGQQQRVALARALATEPHLLLLDEPFSNLDAALRGATRDEVRAILKRTNTTAVMVTHDQQEALSFADRVAVMRDGRLEQVGDPVEVYRSPVSAFVAGFLGRTNLLRGTATGMSATTALGEVPLDRSATGRVVLSLRPEHLSFAPSTQAPDPDGSPVRQPGTGARVKIVRREFRGHDVTFECLLLADGGSTDLAQAGEVRLSVIASPDLETTVGDVLSVVVTGAAVVLGQGATGSQRTEAATTRHVG